MANSQDTAKTQSPNWGYILLAAGILCIVIAAIDAAPSLQSGSQPPNWAALLGLLGAITAIWGGIQAYDSRPLPNDPIRAPFPVLLEKDEPWRASTQLRYLEKLKKEVTSREEDLVNCYDRAKEAYERLIRASGRIEYNRWHRSKATADGDRPEIAKDILDLKERIGRVFSGNVSQEILSIKEDSKKLDLNKQEYQRKLKQLDVPCNLQHDHDQCRRQRQHEREDYYSRIHTIDHRLVELETDQEELKTFNFNNLWTSLGHSAAASAGFASVNKDDLQGMKEKADILKDMPNLRPPAPKPSPEEERQEKKARAEARLRNHEQDRDASLRRALSGKPFSALSESEQYTYKEEENFWNETLKRDRDELRKFQR